MNFTYDSGGTAQQIAWAKEAVSLCTYPLDLLPGVNVTVTWGDDQLVDASGHIHPYMCTFSDGADFTIQIDSRADDPTWSSVSGLPNIAADLQGFYMSSFVHEIGHVVSFSTFDPDADDTLVPVIAEMCALFSTVTVTPTGRDGENVIVKRYGQYDPGATPSLNDWDGPDLEWGQEIREAVAEEFRLLFFAGGGFEYACNRTIWKIDPKDVPTFLRLLSVVYYPGATSGLPDYANTKASVKVESISPLNEYGQAFVSTWAVTSDPEPEIITASLHVTGGAPFWVDATGALQINGDPFGDPPAGYSLAPDGNFLGLTVGDSVTLLPLADVELPGWLVLKTEPSPGLPGGFTAELWTTDPWAAGSAVASINVPNLAESRFAGLGFPEGPAFQYYAADSNLGAPALDTSKTLEEEGPVVTLGNVQLAYTDSGGTYAWGDDFSTLERVPYASDWSFSNIGAGTLVSDPMDTGTVWSVSDEGIGFANQTDTAYPVFPPPDIPISSLSIGGWLRGALKPSVPAAGRLGFRQTVLQARADLARAGRSLARAGKNATPAEAAAYEIELAQEQAAYLRARDQPSASVYAPDPDGQLTGDGGTTAAQLALTAATNAQAPNAGSQTGSALRGSLEP